MPGCPEKGAGRKRREGAPLGKKTRRAGVARPATTRSDEKNGEVNSPLQQKESTAKSGCATKNQDAGLPGKGDGDAKSAKARRYVAREGVVTREPSVIVTTALESRK